jgi:hypothetical protein
MLSPVSYAGQPPELQSLSGIVMAELEPLRREIAMIAVLASMALLMGLITAAIAAD